MAGKTCRCRRGKASAYDGKCGNCRTQRERKAVERMRDGWPRAAAERGWLNADEKAEQKAAHDARWDEHYHAAGLIR
jgi:hypothetical protein